MERRFKHKDSGIIVTNLVNEKTYCNTGSGIVVPAFIVEESADFQEVFPLAYVGNQGELFDYSLREDSLRAFPQNQHKNDTPIWEIWDLENLQKSRLKSNDNKATELSEAEKNKYRLEGWQAARNGLRWIVIQNDARWNTFADWTDELARLSRHSLKADFRGEITKACDHCETPFKTKDENQKLCNPCQFKCQGLEVDSSKHGQESSASY